MRHGKSWQNDFETLYGPQFRAYVTALKTRLLPAFSTIDEEAERMQQATVDRLRQSANEHVDDASLREHAQDEAIDFVWMHYRLKQSLLNLWAAGLYHLLEQLFGAFHREEFFYPAANNPIEAVRQALRKQEGVDLATLPSWPAIEELGLLANCVKHAEGPSCAELRARRPDLLTDPLSLVRHCVETPLLGEGVYVALGDVEKYGAAVEAFLAELGWEIAA